MKSIICLCIILVTNLSISKADELAIFNFTGDLGERYFKLESTVTSGNDESLKLDHNKDKNIINFPTLLKFDLTSNITFKFSNPIKNNLNEGFSLRQTGEMLTLKAVSSGGLIIKAHRVISNANTDLIHLTKSRDVLYTISFEDSQSILAPVKGGLKNQKIVDQVLSFEVGSLSRPELFSLHLAASKERKLFKNKILIDRDLQPIDYQITDLGNGRNLVSINLEKLIGHFDRTIKHSFKFNLALKHDFTDMINNEEIGLTSLGDSIVVQDR